MDSVMLPNINRASSENSVFYNQAGRSGGAASAKSDYELKMDKLVAMYFPTLDSEASVKSRLANLEETASSQNSFNKQAQQTIQALARNVEDVDSNLKSIVLNMQSDFDTRLLTLKKEYDHRFELQASENKRLQSHVASLKSDTNQLKRKMQSTIEKLRKLQHEFGDPDDVEEESSIVFSPNNSLVGSRPNTGF